MWYSGGLTAFASKLDAKKQHCEALHKFLATTQAGQVAVDEDDAETEERTQVTQEAAAVAQSNITDSWQRLSKEARINKARLLAASRAIPYDSAKRMVQRRDDYERLGKLDELQSCSLMTDTIIIMKVTATRRQVKDSKPAAKAWLRRYADRAVAARAVSERPQSSGYWHQC